MPRPFLLICRFGDLVFNPYPHFRGYSPYLLAQQGERIGRQKVSKVTKTHQTNFNAILSPCLKRSEKIGGRAKRRGLDANLEL